MGIKNKSHSNRRGVGSALISAVIFLVIAGLVAAFFFLKTTRITSGKNDFKNMSRLHHEEVPAEKQHPAPVQAPSYRNDYGNDSSTVTLPQPAESKLPPEDDSTPRNGTSDARLAIIIDDMGKDLISAKRLAGISLPITFSIIPGLKHDREVGAYAHIRGLEVIVHAPMEPKGWPQRRLEENGLLLGMEDNTIRERMDDYFERLPGALGVNNHMGSAFTEDQVKMRIVLESIKKNNKFFIDSMTSEGTVGFRLAREMGLKTARRNVFLDNSQVESAIRRQLYLAVSQAKKNGSAIAICHPYEATISTLEQELPRIGQQGVSLVSVSQLVK